MNYEKLTATEVHKIMNDLTGSYEEKKNEIKGYLDEIKVLDKYINDRTTQLEKMEIQYIELMEALVDKQKNESELG